MADVTVTVCVTFELLLYTPHCSGVRQWGTVMKQGGTVTITYPISYTQSVYVNTGSDFNEDNNPAILSFYRTTLSSCICSGRRLNDYNNKTSLNTFGTWISLGK